MKIYLVLVAFIFGLWIKPSYATLVFQDFLMIDSDVLETLHREPARGPENKDSILNEEQTAKLKKSIETETMLTQHFLAQTSRIRGVENPWLLTYLRPGVTLEEKDGKTLPAPHAILNVPSVHGVSESLQGLYEDLRELSSFLYDRLGTLKFLEASVEFCGEKGTNARDKTFVHPNYLLNATGEPKTAKELRIFVSEKMEGYSKMLATLSYFEIPNLVLPDVAVVRDFIMLTVTAQAKIETESFTNMSDKHKSRDLIPKITLAAFSEKLYDTVGTPQSQLIPMPIHQYLEKLLVRWRTALPICIKSTKPVDGVKSPLALTE